MQIEIIDPDPQADPHLLRENIRMVFAGEHQALKSLTIVFVGRDELRVMKNEYFNLDVYTDIIAFHLNEPDQAVEGELYLSFEQISQNARQYRTEIQNELQRVVIHGCLHLCGYEDGSSEEKSQMTILENHYLDMMGNRE